MHNPLIALQDITAGYGATHILQGLSLSIAQGERVAVLGRNGVGKTTLLSTIMGLTQVHCGTLTLAGRDLAGLSIYQRARMGLGLVAQTRDIFPSLSVEENLLAGQRRGVSLAQAYALFPRLQERRRNQGGQLSGGEQQMLAIARTLMAAPDILLLDEPLEGLAPVLCAQLMAVLAELAQDGTRTILLVEQNTGPALRFASRVVILDQGRIVYDGAAAALRASPDILHRHLGVAPKDQD
ncbi:MAG: ABC transporter ATP-binding protein [Paracoccaceae bacterium]|jgi:branched-chain amino acid transport system ATP-binding protein|nr:ABC transporter ATP-binding protein [Paracoccaceae bacterium]